MPVAASNGNSDRRNYRSRRHPCPGDGDWLLVSLAPRFLLLLPLDASTRVDGLRCFDPALLAPHLFNDAHPPDVKVAAAEALSTAQKLAAERLTPRTPPTPDGRAP